MRWWVGEVLAVAAVAAFVGLMLEAIGVDIIRAVAIIILAVADGVLAREGLAFSIGFIVFIALYVSQQKKNKRSND